MREGLIVRVEKILSEAKSKVRSRARIGKEIGEILWTARGVRQWCPFEPDAV